MVDEIKADSKGKIRVLLDKLFAGVDKLTKVQRLLICLGTLLVLGGGYYWFILSPRYETLISSREELKRQEKQLAGYKAKARSLKEYEKKMMAVEEKFHIAMGALPDKKELPTLLDNISNAGTKAGLELRLFQPGGVKQKDFYKEIPISMDISGSYHQIADFFFQVANLNRIVNVRSMSMKTGGKKSGGQSNRVIQMKCSAVTYMFTEQKADSGKGKKRNKKKRG